MKILLVCERADGTDGWSSYSKTLREGLLKLGHEVKTCCRRGKRGDYAVLPSPLSLLSRPYLAWITARKLITILKEFHPDIVHTTVEPYAQALPFVPDEWKKKWMVTFHGSYGVRAFNGFFNRLLAIRMHQALRRSITVSDYTKRRTAEELELYAGKTEADRFRANATVIKNSISIPIWKPEWNQRTGRQILLLGGVKSRKGVLEALNGIAAYDAQYGHNWILTVVGKEEDAYGRMVRQKIQMLELEDRVILTGAVDEKRLEQLYDQASVFLLPSPTRPDTFEGFGIVFLEAAARGIPCIGPSDGGAAEAIVEGKTGYRVDVKKPEEIAARLHDILDTKTITSSACREWAEKFSSTDTIKSIIDLYKTL